jgi:hypothetical protein
LFLKNAIEGEANMNDIVNHGIKGDEIKKEMILKFLENDPVEYNEIDLVEASNQLINDDLGD